MLPSGSLDERTSMRKVSPSFSSVLLTEKETTGDWFAAGGGGGGGEGGGGGGVADGGVWVEPPPPPPQAANVNAVSSSKYLCNIVCFVSCPV